MKFKLLAFLLMLPLSLHAATNAFDNVLIKNNFIYTGGTPALNKVLTSDASGNYYPQFISSLGAFAVTNAPNFFTSASTNTFNAATFTSNMYVRGTLFVNTNATPGNIIAAFQARAAGDYVAHFGKDDGGGGFEFLNGPGTRLISMDFDGGASARLRATGIPLWDYSFSTSGTFRWLNGGLAAMTLSPTVLTIGDSSAYTVTIVGNTVAIPNGINIGSGQLIIPSTGTLTNNSSLTSLNILQASNLVATTFNLTSEIDTLTSTNLNLTVNAGAGPLHTRAQFTSSTNTLTAALPVVNAIYTNNSDRLQLNIAAGAAANTYSYIWTVSGGFTQMFGARGVSVAATNTFTAKIQPFALYMLSNQLGTTTLLPGQWNETRE